MATFIFLEITNREINYLFHGIRTITESAKAPEAAHLTIRGPYRGVPPRRTVERCIEFLRNDVLMISGSGTFNNGREYVVYLEVDSPNLRKVWWKPDYSIRDYGYNPHITIYRGSDAIIGEAIHRFFELERVSLLCASTDFRLVTFVSKQGLLIPPTVDLASYPFHLIRTGRIKENMLNRLQTAVKRARRLSADVSAARDAGINGSRPAGL